MSGLSSSDEELERRVAVRRAWCVLNGIDPEEFEAEVEARAAELRAGFVEAVWDQAGDA